MSAVKRYDLANPYCEECEGVERESAGDYVLHCDHLAAVAELRAEVERLREARLLWGHLNDMGVDPRDKDELWVLLGKALSRIEPEPKLATYCPKCNGGGETPCLTVDTDLGYVSCKTCGGSGTL